jgi:hypothetical protein
MKYLILLLLLSCNTITRFAVVGDITTEVKSCHMSDTFIYYRTDTGSYRKMCILVKCECIKIFEAIE